MSDNLRTWPERIYLQNTDEAEPMSYDEAMRHEDAVTWCDARQEKADVEYVRADVAAAALVGAALVIEEVDDETRTYTMNGIELIRANHDDDGWGGMARIDTLMRAVAGLIGAQVIEQ